MLRAPHQRRCTKKSPGDDWQYTYHDASQQLRTFIRTCASSPWSYRRARTCLLHREDERRGATRLAHLRDRSSPHGHPPPRSLPPPHTTPRPACASYRAASWLLRLDCFDLTASTWICSDLMSSQVEAGSDLVDPELLHTAPSPRQHASPRFSTTSSAAGRSGRAAVLLPPPPLHITPADALGVVTMSTSSIVVELSVELRVEVSIEIRLELSG